MSTLEHDDPVNYQTRLLAHAQPLERLALELAQMLNAAPADAEPLQIPDDETAAWSVVQRYSNQLRVLIQARDDYLNRRRLTRRTRRS